MEVDPPSPSSPAGPSYGEMRSQILSALSDAMASLPRRAPERVVRDALERHLGPVVGTKDVNKEDPPKTPEAGPGDTGAAAAATDDKLAAVKKQHRAEMRRVLDSQGWRVELEKIMGNFVDGNYDPFYNLLEAVLVSSELGYSDTNTPFAIVEEVMETVTIEDTEHIFDFIEQRSERLTDKMVPNKGKFLTLLRLCNDLLRRVSRTQNTVYSGRILMYLSTAYPLSERSGVNLRGDFNKDNVTHYEGEGIEDDEADMMTEEGASEDLAHQEARFYRRFWGMQKFFSNPPSIFVEGNFEKLQTAVEATLAKFEKIAADEARDVPATSSSSSSSATLAAAAAAAAAAASAANASSQPASSSAPPQSSSSSSRKRKQRPDDKALGKGETFFFPKFLTSSKLFDLELRDPQFRRHILVQLHIIFQYLFLHSSREKERLTEYTAKMPQPPGSAGGANKSVQPSSVLSEAQLKWVEGARVRCIKVLETVPGNGRAFLRTVVQTLTHEKAWIKWKLESCQGFERTGLPLDLQMASKRRKAEQLPGFLRKEAWQAANEAREDPLTKLKTPLNLPTLEGYMSEIREDMNDYEDPEERRSADPRVQWKTWRLVRKSAITTFYKMSQGHKGGRKDKDKEKEQKDKDKEKEKTPGPVSAAGSVPPSTTGNATPEIHKEGANNKEPSKEDIKEGKEGYPDLEVFVVEWEREREMANKRATGVKMEAFADKDKE